MLQLCPEKGKKGRVDGLPALTACPSVRMSRFYMCRSKKWSRFKFVYKEGINDDYICYNNLLQLLLTL